MRELLELFLKNRGSPVLLALHSQADVDTLAAALALKEYFPKGRIVVPDSLGSSGRKLNERFGGEVLRFKDLSFSPSALIILDTNSYLMLAGMADYIRRFPGDIAVLDHHTLHTDAVKATHLLIDNHASATCELVFEVFKALDFPISSRCAELLLMGIVFDSADLESATARTLEIAAYLLTRTKLSLAQVFAMVESHEDANERVVILKSLSRAKVYRAGDFIFATSSASSYEAEAASMLVELGADYAFVAQETRNELRISARCRAALVDERHADVAAIMADIGGMIGGSGGGHPAASGADGPKKELQEQALERCVQLAKEQIRASALERIDGKILPRGPA